MTTDYFTLLSMERRFDIDPVMLEHHYYTLQRQYHPDRQGGTAVMDRQHNLQQSIDINRAYDTLKNPLSRAQHLLHLQGITVGAERDTVKPDPGMLAECMEWREALEEAEDRGAVEQLYRKAFQARETCLANLEHACNEAQWETAAQAALKLSYMEKLLDDIQRKAHLP